jgi:hypothetical protein
MNDREAMKLALFALDIVKIHYTQSRHINEAIAALKERLAQPEQEPVAWLCTPNEDGLFGLPLSDKGCKDCFPVYRHPPQRTWVDLSDEDIEECFTITPDLYLKRHIAQRILDKFKEKNNG